jgi:iron-sulfur cluster repair protein YtfE (RIC family)
MRRDPSLIPLSHQHHNGLALCVMTRRSLARDSSPPNIVRLARRVIDRYELELINHFEIEEQVLFPASGPMPLVDALLAEHRAIEAFIPPLRTAPTADLLEQFCELLSKHIRREENELFEQIQSTLPREVLDRVGERDRSPRRADLPLTGVPRF